MTRQRRPMISLAVAAVLLASCDGTGADGGVSPRSNVQEDLMTARVVFAPAPALHSAEPTPSSATQAPQTPPRLGIAGIARVADVEGNVHRGRDFAFDNCRPCHVVGPDQRSATRFSDAPDFQSIANMPSTTPASLIVWLTNPHPTMPSLVLSPQEVSDVIAYIESLRTAR